MQTKIKWYSPEEREFLRNNYRNMTNEALAKAIGRTHASVIHQLREMKLSRDRCKIWAPEDIEQMRIDVLTMTRKQIAAKFNCEDHHIKVALKKHGITIGRTGRFEKGIVPWTKGKKMPPGWGGETRFKKGQKPVNTLTDGTIITRKYVDGHRYRWIKISHKNWRPLSHVVYEQNFGPLPEGHFISFKDGNTLNCDPNNLKPESKQEHMARNTIARFPPELISTIMLLNKFKRKVKSYEKQN